MNDINLDWQKMDNLIPAIVQDADSRQILMLGYMNQEALAKTMETGLVTFYSRSKQALWTKGETSENFLRLVDISSDCDQDALLILARPQGPTCHLGTTSCFKDEVSQDILTRLQVLLAQRYAERPSGSYTSELFAEGTKRIAQKVGEEGVEVALAATTGDKQEFISESADLLFHLLVLCQDKAVKFAEIMAELQKRQQR